jgi:putative ABC transport system permease protein
MGISSPVGKWFSFWDTPGTIVGVVKDFHSTSLQNEINPIVLKIDSYWLNYMFVKIKSDNISLVVGSLEKIWNEVLPGYPYEHRVFDETIDRRYRTEERLKSIFGYFTFLAIFISCLGLFGLSSYMAERRTKEIGIRKVLGASVLGIIILISKEFVLLILAANIIALPVAYYYMDHWLHDYAYHTNLGWEIFIIAGGLSLIITLLTVSYQALRAASTNPVQAIKYE